MIKPRVEVRLIPLITVNGLSFYTVESTGKKGNFDQNKFITLKFIIDNVNTTTKQIFEQMELCALQCRNDTSLPIILQNIPKQPKLTNTITITNTSIMMIYVFTKACKKMSLWLYIIW